MAPRSTSTRRQATSPSASSPSPSSTDSSPDTLGIPNPEEAPPDPQDLEAPASSPDLHELLFALTGAAIRYGLGRGSWDDVSFEVHRIVAFFPDLADS